MNFILAYLVFSLIGTALLCVIFKINRGGL
jgi:hypothetical protein